MQAGDLRHRIEIQRATIGEDAEGFQTVQYAPWKTVWAKANGLFGKEWWEARSYDAEQTVEFTIRQKACPDLSIKDRIFFRGQTYNILSVDNILFKDSFLKIRAVANVSEEVMP